MRSPTEPTTLGLAECTVVLAEYGLVIRCQIADECGCMACGCSRRARSGRSSGLALARRCSKRAGGPGRTTIVHAKRISRRSEATVSCCRRRLPDQYTSHADVGPLVMAVVHNMPLVAAAVRSDDS